MSSTGNLLRLVKRTAIAYRPRIGQTLGILVICSPFCKRQEIGSTGEYRVRGLCSASSSSDF